MNVLKRSSIATVHRDLCLIDHGHEEPADVALAPRHSHTVSFAYRIYKFTGWLTAPSAVLVVLSSISLLSSLAVGPLKVRAHFRFKACLFKFTRHGTPNELSVDAG